MPQDSSTSDSSTVYIYDSIDGAEYFIPRQMFPGELYKLDKKAKHEYLAKKYNPIFDTSYRQEHFLPPEEASHETPSKAITIVLVVSVLLLYIGLKILPSIHTKKLTASQQYKYFLICCAVLAALGFIFKINILMVPPLVILAVAGLAAVKEDTPPVEEESTYTLPSETVTYAPKQLVYNGDELNFSAEVLTIVLTKHSSYFNKLDNLGKDKFIHRLQKFIAVKTFIIHDDSGFREMPILISAAAIQLSFGFDKYLLFSFPNIHIYPEEFLGVHPFIRFLEGNVSGSNINISWKHFLDGFKYPDDGQNVGLHEMAHAYHFQNFETGTHEDQDFVDNFPKYNTYANKAFSSEALPGNDLYTDYALKDFQEFWAESVEIFFEKPVQLKVTYPDLYIAMCDLMNQQPC